MVHGQGLPPVCRLHLPGCLPRPHGRARVVRGRAERHGRRRCFRPEALPDEDRHHGVQRQRGPLHAHRLGVQLRLRRELRHEGEFQALQPQPLQHVRQQVRDDLHTEDGADGHGHLVLLRRDPEDVRRRPVHAFQAHVRHSGHDLALPLHIRAVLLLALAGGGSLQWLLRLQPAHVHRPGLQAESVQGARDSSSVRGGPERPHRPQPDDGLHPLRGHAGGPAEQGRPGDAPRGPRRLLLQPALLLRHVPHDHERLRAHGLLHVRRRIRGHVLPGQLLLLDLQHAHGAAGLPRDGGG
mmetsp:Transcript_43880/g.129938  ORF Transcript_43880/g.129938 Transcript_43880/m.129938 type:complete len:296 (+) Transcript_43880:676-1563(+)